MESIAFDIWASGRMNFSDEDKKECLETVRTVMNIAFAVRKDSLLWLESMLPLINDEFLKKMLSFMLDAIDAESIEKVMYNYIVAGDYRGKELLGRIVVTKGLSAISKGYSPRHVCDFMASYFGEDYISEFVKIDDKFMYKSIEEFLDAVTTKEAKDTNKTEKTDLLENTLEKMDDFAIQSLLKYLTPSDIIIVLHGASKPVMGWFLNNMMQRTAETIMDGYRFQGNIKPEHILKVQNKILDKIAELKEKGEIIFKD